MVSDVKSGQKDPMISHYFTGFYQSHGGSARDCWSIHLAVSVHQGIKLPSGYQASNNHRVFFTLSCIVTNGHPTR